jgi:7,8-dihydro-6-hydroxymethylpterin-pyrophosphokinase
MYYTDQGSFINGAVEISTDLPPLGLLDVLQGIEAEMGRVKVIEKGPRPIDLDVILYGEQKVWEERLTVPHRLVGEREFVLRPLNEYVIPLCVRWLSMLSGVHGVDSDWLTRKLLLVSCPMRLSIRQRVPKQRQQNCWQG